MKITVRPLTSPRGILLDHTNWDSPGTQIGPGSNPDTWVWHEELQRFYHTPALEESLQGIQPTAKSGVSGRPDQPTLPGQGQPYPDCGEEVLYLCPRCGHMKEGHRCCRRATCPKCYTTWAWLQARRSALRILKARKLFASRLGWRNRPIHVVASLPPKDWHLFFDAKTYPRVRRRVYKLLTKAGTKGGLLIPHPWRQKCALCDGDIVGSWRVDKETDKFTEKERYCVKCGSKQFKWIDGPHFHFVGYGWIEHAKEIHQATGYVIKNIGVIDNVGGAVWYQLTHCGLRAGRQTVTYFGLCALSKYKSPPVPKELNLCPVCGAIMRKYQDESQTGPPPPPPWH